MEKTLQLISPITVDGTTHTTLTMARPTVMDQIVIKTKYGTAANPKFNDDGDQYDELETDIGMFARLTDQPIAVIEELDDCDFEALSALYIELSNPITVADEDKLPLGHIPLGVPLGDLGMLTMRAPKVRDHLWLKTHYGTAKQPKKAKQRAGVYDDLDRDIAMFARLTEQDETTINGLDWGDWGKCARMYRKLSQRSKS
ncbi:phage tail assembly protein [Photobacterium leiognathi]|uniref:phage tail assembly protein n=1 Tax=Photobacterium leiognathi TaxID=553611 RepID=UPI0027394263|nr:phage tail assembly protein [Photobacterium leiognathi]